MPKPDGHNLTTRIVEDLGVAVVSGTYSLKNPFPIEADLCTQYGASRSVLREAVKMLTAKGLLSARPRQGTWIQPEEQWNLLDPDVLRWLLERNITFSVLREFALVRLAVEPKAAALAATVATSDAKDVIRTAIEQMARADQDEADPLVADIAFHVAVLRASGNRFFAQFSGVTETTLRFSIRMQDRYKGVRRASVPDHKRIADAIIAGDAVAAEEAAQSLVQEALDLINKAIADKGLEPRRKDRGSK